VDGHKAESMYVDNPITGRFNKMCSIRAKCRSENLEAFDSIKGAPLRYNSFPFCGDFFAPRPRLIKINDSWRDSSVHPVEPSGLTDANEARLQYFLSNVPTVKRIIVCLVGEAQFRMQILHQSITIKLARRPNPQITSSTCKT
jgi:hypothetical protein